MTEDGVSGSFIYEGLDDLRGYTQQPSLTLAQIDALLESHKRRLIVPTGRVEEFETAVRDGGLAHSVTVIGHPWLKADQAFLLYSEADQEADMRAAVEKAGVELLEAAREQNRADMEQLRARLEDEARQEREWQFLLAVYAARPQFPGPMLGGPFDD